MQKPISSKYTSVATLRENDVAVEVWTLWLHSLERDAQRLADLLPQAERDRTNSFLNPSARLQFIATRYALRSLLAERLGCDLTGITFEIGPHGKPALKHPATQDLHFNLSHSGELALIAISSTGAVGVDVEQNRDRPNAVQLANRFFTETESRAIGQMPAAERSETFLRMWTQKEAMLKATGLGIANGLKNFEISPSLRGGLLSVEGNAKAAESWTLCSWQPTERYFAALATPFSNAKVLLKNYSFPTD